jgi:hypothetical protein
MSLLSLLTAAGALVSAHGSELAALAYALLNLANALAKGTEAKSLLMKLADLLSVLTRKDAPGTLKLPLARSSAPARGPIALVPLVLLGLAPTLSGCACWGAKANEPACIVAHQSVDCSTDAIKSLIPQGAALVLALFQGQTPDPGEILAALKGFSADAALCIVQAVANDFLRQPRGMVDDRVLALRQAEGLLRFQLGIAR